MPSQQAIGVFDSGVGGLSVLAHIRQRLPAERLLYVGDSAFMPYGCKPEHLVEERCMRIARFFVEQDCKAIVLACNTATAVAIQQIRALYDMPVIGMEPAVKPAVQHSRAKLVGILATSGTVGSEKFKRLKQRYAAHAQLMVQPCPGLVEQIEKGDLNGQKIHGMLLSFLQPLMQRGMDTLVLGCTHYPFITPLIRDIVGEDVCIVDTGDAIASEVLRRLQLAGLRQGSPQNRNQPHASAAVEFWSSGDVQQVAGLMSRLWGSKLVVRPLTC